MKSKLVIVFVCAALFLTGCEGLTKGKAAAEAAIEHFHQLYSEGKLDEIWEQAHPKFRSGSKKDRYDEFMDAIRRKLGKVISTSNGGWRVNSYNLTTIVLMTQKTMFEKGEGTESFTFEMDGEKAVLVGYNIQSMDLITK